MEAFPPLPISTQKNDLLKHLNIDPKIYSLMAKETDIVYKWLTSEKCHLKENCSQNPPFHWSDVKEKSKDDAVERIVQSGNPQTQCVWSLAALTFENWIARWFLYHKFRYRDGRNRNPAKNSNIGKHQDSDGHGDSSKPHHHQSEEHEVNYEHESYYLMESMTSDSFAAPVSQGRGAVATRYTYPVTQIYTPYDANQGTIDERKVYYDPVRDKGPGQHSLQENVIWSR